MAFANFSVLAFGSLLMTVPVVLHLLMKRRPRHQVFPALRFLRQRQATNQRQMRLRHWLLLGLRIAVIGLLASLFARPSVDSVASGSWLKALLLGVLSPFAIVAAIYCWTERKGGALLAIFGLLSFLLLGGLGYFLYHGMTSSRSVAIGDQDAPVAAALVFDTSPRMGLLHQNQTRLQESQQIATELLQKLPVDSEVAVVDAAAPGTFSVDIGNTMNMVASLQVLGSEYPLVDLVRRGIELVAGRQDKRQEVYVLTDLSATVWAGSKFATVRQQLEEHPEISFFILDVGVKSPRNHRIGDLRLSTDSLALGQSLRLETSLRSLGAETDEEVTVEVAIEQQDPTRPVIIDDEVVLPESTVRDRSQLRLLAQNEIPVNFEIGNLSPGIHHGQINLSTPDGLPIDDERFFTIEVRPPLDVLLIVSDGAEPRYVDQAISPTEFREQNQNAFRTRIIRAEELSSVSLDDFAAIGLLDPEPLPAQSWRQLADYVDRGGSLAMFLGHNVSRVEQFNKLAESVLPGSLGFQWRTAKNDVLFLSPSDTSHPMFESIRGRKTTIAWDESPIFLHWKFTELKPGANVILRYSNNQPAIIETVLGEGTILTMTTPVSDRRNQPDRKSWNHLPTSDDPLPFFVLIYEMFPYLANRSGSTWNYQVGEIVELPVDTMQTDATWQLFTPAMDWHNVRSQDSKLTIANTPSPGHYRLKLDRETSTGFSSNLPEAATDLKRQDPSLFDELFGENRYSLTRGTEELTRGIGQARVGRELFPFLMLCVVGILAMEYLVSNRFYEIR